MKTLRRSLLLAAALFLGLSAQMRAELMYGYSATNNSFIRFDSASPSTIVASTTVTGLQTGETLTGIDLRPANGMVYAIGSTSRLYTINPTTGAATQVGSAGAFTLNGTNFGVDFNPVPDRIRLVSDSNQNLRLNPNDGTLTATDGTLNPAGNVVAVAYSNNVAGATSTVLYAIDAAAGTLGIISVPNAGGPINLVGSLGLGTNLNAAIGFDISGLSGVAYASIVTGGLSRLYTINLSTGAASLVGNIGTGAISFSGLTAATAVPEPSTYALLGVGALFALGYARRSRKQRAAAVLA